MRIKDHKVGMITSNNHWIRESLITLEVRPKQVCQVWLTKETHSVRWYNESAVINDQLLSEIFVGEL